MKLKKDVDLSFTQERSIGDEWRACRAEKEETVISGAQDALL